MPRGRFAEFSQPQTFSQGSSDVIIPLVTAETLVCASSPAQALAPCWFHVPRRPRGRCWPCPQTPALGARRGFPKKKGAKKMMQRLLDKKFKVRFICVVYGYLICVLEGEKDWECVCIRAGLRRWWWGRSNKIKEFEDEISHGPTWLPGPMTNTPPITKPSPYTFPPRKPFLKAR